MIIFISCYGNERGFFIKNFILFENIDKNEYSKALKCLNGSTHNYLSKEYLNIDKNTLKAAVILEGIIDLISIDEDGKLIIHDRFFKGDSFVFDIKDENKEFISVSNSKVLLLDLESIFKKEKSNCSIRKKIMENIIKLQNNQNQELNYKLDIYLEKSLRKKIIKYLKKSQMIYNSKVITLPFKRAELAAYLSCDRAALSRELSRMEKDGIVKVNKNKIELIKI